MHVRLLDYLAVGIRLLKCQCSFVDIWSISINSSHVTGPHLKATLSLWKHQTNLWSCQTPKIMKTQRNLFYFSLSILFSNSLSKFWWFLIYHISFANKPFWIWWLTILILIWDYLMSKVNEKKRRLESENHNRDVYCRPTLVIRLFWVAALGGGWGC